MCVVLVMQLDERSLPLLQERCCVIASKKHACSPVSRSCLIVARIDVVSKKDIKTLHFGLHALE
jgi:hypothetical protein